MTKRRSVAAAVALLVASACSQPIAERGRYRMASDPGSRHGFRYVQDTETGLWVIRDCELRVAEARALPEPLQDEAHGGRLAVSIFRPESVESGLLLSIDFERRDGYRVWRGASSRSRRLPHASTGSCRRRAVGRGDRTAASWSDPDRRGPQPEARRSGAVF